jgi:hypothetical protein
MAASDSSATRVAIGPIGASPGFGRAIAPRTIISGLSTFATRRMARGIAMGIDPSRNRCKVLQMTEESFIFLVCEFLFGCSMQQCNFCSMSLRQN